MSDDIVCKMANCDGTLGDETFPLQTGCSSHTFCSACSKCNRVHSQSGYLMFSRSGHALYLRDKYIEYVLEPVNFEIGETYLSKGYLFVSLDDGEEVPEMVSIDPETPLVHDGINIDGMFRFHSEKGTKYLLHRGDVNFIEKKQ